MLDMIYMTSHLALIFPLRSERKEELISLYYYLMH